MNKYQDIADEFERLGIIHETTLYTKSGIDVSEEVEVWMGEELGQSYLVRVWYWPNSAPTAAVYKLEI
jgi:hypothetical protein